MRHKWIATYVRMVSWGLLPAVLIGLVGCVQTTAKETQTTGLTGDKAADAPFMLDRPPTAKTLYGMSDLMAAQGKERECEMVLKQSIRMYPNSSPAYNSLAELYVRQGQVSSALSLLLEARDKFPRDTIILNNLGMVLVIRKEYEQALQYFTRASGVAPGFERYRGNMAMVLGLLGRFDESQALYEQFLSVELAAQNVELLRQSRNDGKPPAGSQPVPAVITDVSPANNN